MRHHYARLSEPPGTEPTQPLPTASLRFASHEVESAKRKFGVAGRYAVLCPGAEYGPAKRWPYFASLAEKMNLPVVLLGSANDREACEGIGGKKLAGGTTPHEANDLIPGAPFGGRNHSG